MRGDKVSRERHRAPNPVRFAEPQRTLRLRRNPRYSLIQATNKFTELKTVYQDEAYSYLIANFQPHPAACSGCPQQ